MAEARTTASFGPGLFSFLADLRANNNREWFAANRDRYEEQLLEPALAFIDAFAPRLEKISPHFRAVARPSGGSLFRIYRDTRFAKDKSPYKDEPRYPLPARAGEGRPSARLLPAHRPRRDHRRRRRHLAPLHLCGDCDPRGNRRRPRTLANCDPHRRIREAAQPRRRHPQACAILGRPGPPPRRRPKAQGLLRLRATLPERCHRS